MRVLITCGPTWVPIDDVRVISNISSGEMGHLIAEAFAKQSAQVTIIEGPVTHELVRSSCLTLTAVRHSRESGNPVKIIKYQYFDELAAALKKELSKKYDIVVHAAAVSDFKVKGASKTKLSSSKKLTLNLVGTPKLIQEIKSLSPNSFLVGFKLESSLGIKNIFATVRPLFTTSGCDLVVANTLKGGYRGFLIDADGNILKKSSNKKTIACHLVKLIHK